MNSPFNYPIDAEPCAPVLSRGRIHPMVVLILGLCIGIVATAGLVLVSPAPGLRCVSYLTGEKIP